MKVEKTQKTLEIDSCIPNFQHFTKLKITTRCLQMLTDTCKNGVSNSRPVVHSRFSLHDTWPHTKKDSACKDIGNKNPIE